MKPDPDKVRALRAKGIPAWHVAAVLRCTIAQVSGAMRTGGKPHVAKPEAIRRMLTAQCESEAIETVERDMEALKWL